MKIDTEAFKRFFADYGVNAALAERAMLFCRPMFWALEHERIRLAPKSEVDPGECRRLLSLLLGEDVPAVELVSLSDFARRDGEDDASYATRVEAESGEKFADTEDFTGRLDTTFEGWAELRVTETMGAALEEAVGVAFMNQDPPEAHRFFGDAPELEMFEDLAAYYLVPIPMLAAAAAVGDAKMFRRLEAIADLLPKAIPYATRPDGTVVLVVA